MTLLRRGALRLYNSGGEGGLDRRLDQPCHRLFRLRHRLQEGRRWRHHRDAAEADDALAFHANLEGDDEAVRRVGLDPFKERVYATAG